MLSSSFLRSFGLRIGAVLLLAFGTAHVFAADQNLNVLFIGNSFTGRHNLSQVVKAMAEAGNPGLRFDVTTVIYGGRTLKDHWRLGTQNFVSHVTLTRDDARTTIRGLEETVARDPKDNYAQSAIGRQKQLLATLDQPRRKWDVVVLQSYRDDTQGEASTYLEYAPKFAALIRAQGGRIVLYETTPDTQNATALTSPPDPEPVKAKARLIARLAKQIDAAVVPMSMVALHCQTTHPEITLRFVNDGHLNQTMAYLTACTFQAALFGRPARDNVVDSITDTRFLDAANKQKDRDAGPLRRIFVGKERADLQQIAWEGFQQFQSLSQASR